MGKGLVSQVSEERLRQTVRELVNLGNRLGGTKSGDRAAFYVTEKFKSYGFRPEKEEDPERLTYTNLRWSLDIREPRELRGMFRNEWLAGFSPSVGPRESRVIFSDIQDAINKERMESTAVVVPYMVNEKKYRELVEAGALCVLSYYPNTAGSYTNWSFIYDLPASKTNPIPLFSISINNGEKLRKTLRAGKRVVLKFSTKTSIAPGKPKTVVATLKGLAEEYFIICAHDGDLETGGPGADDNASGVAGVLELSKILNSLVRTKAIPKPKKTIKFIAWGSEYFSTEAYVRQNKNELGKILAVLNFDEIGTGKTRNCLYFEGNDVPQNEHLLRVLQNVGEEYVGKKGFWSESTTNPSQGGTDSYVFLQEYLRRLSVPIVEIPSVTIYTAAWNVPKSIPQTLGWKSSAWKGHPDSVNIDYSPYYHSSLDIPETTTEKEPFNMIWAVKAVGIALLRLAW